MRGLLALVLLSAHLTQADELPARASVVCPAQTSERGVTCCLSDVSQCETIANLGFLDSTLKRAQTVIGKYYDQQFKYGQVANCHWNTLSYLSNQDLNYRLQDPDTLWNWLVENGKEITAEEAGVGDVVLFIFRGQIRDVVLEGSTPKRVWVDFDSLEHSAIVVDKDLNIFQKENLHSQVFSVAGVEATRQAYENSYKSATKWVKGQLTARFFRPNPLQGGAEVALLTWPSPKTALKYP